MSRVVSATWALKYFLELTARYESENYRLRKVAALVAAPIRNEGCGYCPYDAELGCDTETIPMRDGCKLYREMRELGIEVQDDPN